MTDYAAAKKLDPREQHFRIPGPIEGLSLFLRLTLEDQWNRFVEDVPKNEPPVLSRSHFDDWGKHYLDSDPESRSRDPAGVKTTLGPFSEIIKAWHGQLAYDPALVRAPVAIIRGEWDGLMLDEDAHWLFNAFTQSPDKRDIKLAVGRT